MNVETIHQERTIALPAKSLLTKQKHLLILIFSVFSLQQLQQITQTKRDICLSSSLIAVEINALCIHNHGILEVWRLF